MSTQAIDFDTLRRPDPPPRGRYRSFVSWLDTATKKWVHVESRARFAEWADAMRQGMRRAARVADKSPGVREVLVRAVAC